MATDAKTEMTEAELLHFYLELRFSKGQRNGSLDDVMAGFAEYRRQLAKVREFIAEGLESSAQEGSLPLDHEAFWAELDAEMDARGIPE